MHTEAMLVPAHARVDGLLEVFGDLAVEGRVEGEVRADGIVTVDGSGTCVATITAHTVRVYGEVIGDVSASHSISVHAGARVVGDLRAPEIAVDGKARVDGRVDLGAPEPRAAELRRVAVRTRGAALVRPVVPDQTQPNRGPTATPDRDIQYTDEEPTRDQGGRRLPELIEPIEPFDEPTTPKRPPPGPRRVPRFPRPRGRVRVNRGGGES